MQSIMHANISSDFSFDFSSGVGSGVGLTLGSGVVQPSVLESSWAMVRELVPASVTEFGRESVRASVRASVWELVRESSRASVPELVREKKRMKQIDKSRFIYLTFCSCSWLRSRLWIRFRSGHGIGSRCQFVHGNGHHFC